jgi:hypothetical protein
MPDEPELRVLLHEEQRHNHISYVHQEQFDMLVARVEALEARLAAHEVEPIELVEEEDEPPNDNPETDPEGTGGGTGDGGE